MPNLKNHDAAACAQRTQPHPTTNSIGDERSLVHGFLGFLLMLLLSLPSAWTHAQTVPDLFAQSQHELLNTSPPNETLQKAEFNYRARRLGAAMEQFGLVAAMQDHPFAWMRIGNICHRRGDPVGALDAYKRAERAASSNQRFAQLKQRAVMNQALLGLDQAQVALERLGSSAPGHEYGVWADEVRMRLDELGHAVPAMVTEPAALELPANPALMSANDR